MIQDIQLIIIDLFCGAGGVTIASELATVNDNKCAIVIACVNHDQKAIESHKLNHKHAIHFVEDVRTISIIELKKIVDYYQKLYPNARLVLHASLECTHFSKAKGGLPRDEDSRTLANSLFMVWNPNTREYESGDSYIQILNPDIISIENVKDFMSWGPLDENGKPISKVKGINYELWKRNIQSFGYDFDYRMLNAANFGAFTSRERYFAQFVKYGLPITWPQPTHDKKASLNAKKWKAVKDVLDLNDEGKSMFTRKKPHCDKTCKRIYEGLIKYAAEEMFLTAYYSGGGQIHSINEPCATIPTKDRFSLTTCHFIDKQYGTGSAQSIRKPSGTLTTTPKLNLVSFNWLMDMQFNNIGYSVEKPCPTIIARQDKKPLYLVSANSGSKTIAINSTDSPYMQKIKEFCNEHGIIDIKTRMLKIIELKRITGFPENYILVGRKDVQKKFIGNAVEVRTFKAIIEAIATGLIRISKSKAA